MDERRKDFGTNKNNIYIFLFFYDLGEDQGEAEGTSRKRRFLCPLMFLRSTDIDGLHGYHHSNRLDTLSTQETNCSKNDPLLTTKFEDFQDLLVWRLSEPFFLVAGHKFIFFAGASQLA